FGSHVFSDRVMRERLPKEAYRALRRTIERGVTLEPHVADVVANAMKDWAIERGATHYTHWFQPLSDSTAEKHDSFISPLNDGTVIMEFSGKQLIKGEPDASSFPSGGLRSTFEARGYTAWDCTSNAFLKKDGSGNVTLCIPTAFCSYTGEALDKKTPLLRSMNAVSKEALRVLKALGNREIETVLPMVGTEQEYFLVDKQYFLQRLDLRTCGRTLFGASAPKGQEMEDQYFGAIKDRVSEFMRDLDMELWRMGIASKTKHNEVAPAQYENAPIFTTANIAADHDQLVMETMRKIALRHDLVCLLHEKPYAGVNGSGKHNNWSLNSRDGQSLLEPGQTPHENKQFLIFLCALLQGIDRYPGLLRAAAGSASNDLRLGGHEAPPAIISVFLGEELTEILWNLAKGEKVASKEQDSLHIGVDTLPPLPRDNTDRNRTSPFAFTGNKFEYRMVGSADSISTTNVVLNTIVAESLTEFAHRLETADDVNSECEAIVKDVMNNHGRIIFNGNGYSEEWRQEAEQRGLPDIASTVDALEAFNSKQSIELFEKYKVFTANESRSRYRIFREKYSRHINVEARTAIEMTNKEYLPAVIDYATKLADAVKTAEAAGVKGVAQKERLKEVAHFLESAHKKLKILEQAVDKANRNDDVAASTEIYRDEVLPAIHALRENLDELEILLPKDKWPVPSYADMLYML
ncbi:MAG: glutamine synthetase III, partial [Lentisphaeria bacterium]